MTFHEWMHAIDVQLLPVMGVTTSDIADRCYRDMYDDEVTPAEVVADIIEEGIDAL